MPILEMILLGIAVCLAGLAVLGVFILGSAVVLGEKLRGRIRNERKE